MYISVGNRGSANRCALRRNSSGIRLPSERVVARSAALGPFSFIGTVHGTVGLAFINAEQNCFSCPEDVLLVLKLQ